MKIILIRAIPLLVIVQIPYFWLKRLFHKFYPFQPNLRYSSSWQAAYTMRFFWLVYLQALWKHGQLHKQILKFEGILRFFPLQKIWSNLMIFSEWSLLQSLIFFLTSSRLVISNGISTALSFLGCSKQYWTTFPNLLD